MSQKVKDLSGKTLLQELEDMRYNKDSITSCRINVLHLNSPSGIYLAPLTPLKQEHKRQSKIHSGLVNFYTWFSLGNPKGYIFQPLL